MTELEELRAWKAAAMRILAEWDRWVHVGCVRSQRWA